MAARAKTRAAYGLLALVAVKVASSAPSQGAETVSLLAAARTDGSARYLPSQKGQLHLGRAQIVNLHGCETRLRTTPMGAGRARIHLLSPFFGMKAVDVRDYMLEHFGTLKAYVNCDVTLDPRWTAVTRIAYGGMVDAHHVVLYGPGWAVTPTVGRNVGETQALAHLGKSFFETPPGFYLPLRRAGDVKGRSLRLEYHFELGNGTSSDAGDDELSTLRLDVDVQTATRMATRRVATMIRAFPQLFYHGETHHAPAGATTTSVRAPSCFEFRRDVLVLGLRVHTHSRGLVSCLTAGDVSVCRPGNVTNTWSTRGVPARPPCPPPLDRPPPRRKWLDPPVLVPAGEKASFNCTYDGRAITWGFASSDEMCIAYFAVTPASRSNLDAQSLAARGLPGPEGCKVQSFP